MDVQPKLGARVRLLAAGDVNKNDPNDARSVAVAALRSAGVREVRPDDHAAVLKIWSKRYRDLGRTRTQVACRLHAVLGELIPGGVPKAITTARAARVLRAIEAAGAVEAARCELAARLMAAGRVDVHAADDVPGVGAEHGVGEPAALGEVLCVPFHVVEIVRDISRGQLPSGNPGVPGCDQCWPSRPRNRPRCAAARAGPAGIPWL